MDSASAIEFKIGYLLHVGMTQLIWFVSKAYYGQCFCNRIQNRLLATCWYDIVNMVCQILKNKQN